MNFFSIKPVILWTDIFVLLLFLMLIAFIFVIKKDPKLRLAWKKVYIRKINIISIIILLCYFSIAVLDSIHFRKELQGNFDNNKDYSTRVTSLLDVFLSPIIDNSEKTYSAPFALYSYVEDLVKNEDGNYTWKKIRLKHGGFEVKNEKEKYLDITKKTLIGLLVGILMSFIIIGSLIIIIGFSSKKTFIDLVRDIWRNRHNNYSFPFITCFISLSFIIIIISICYLLMPYYHILGTDKVGKDVFYISIKSIRTGVVIGVLTTIVMLPFAISLGTIAGYFGGIIDDIIQYIYTTISSIPGVLLIAASILILQVYIDKRAQSLSLMIQRTDLRLFMLCVVLGITGWIGLCRLLRAETMKLRTENYVLAAKALGVNNINIIFRHIIPNLSHIILIASALDFSTLVLAEAVLSYVGVGVDPSTYSWGNMINGARMEMAREPIVWWSLLGAFVFMFVLVVAANIFSDAVRDSLDPRIN